MAHEDKLGLLIRPPIAPVLQMDIIEKINLLAGVSSTNKLLFVLEENPALREHGLNLSNPVPTIGARVAFFLQ